MSRPSSFAVVVAAVLVPALAWGQAPIPIAGPAPPTASASPAPVVVPGPVVVPAPPIIVPAQAAVVVPAPQVQVATPVNPADGECVTTTTTTTRCTGAAAPYASRPAPPQVIIAPPQVMQPVPVVLPSGFHLQQDPDGNWWRVKKHHGRPAVWVPGLVLWLSSYIVGDLAGAMQLDPTPALPILGPLLEAAFNNDHGYQTAWAVDGLVQLGGFVMFIVGASMDGKLERLPITVSPIAFNGGGSGVGLSGRF